MGEALSRKYQIVLSVPLLVIALAAIWTVRTSRAGSDAAAHGLATLAPPPLNRVRADGGGGSDPEPTPLPEAVEEASVTSGSTLYAALRSAGLTNTAAHSLLSNIRSLVDLRRIAAGTAVRAIYGTEDMAELPADRIPEAMSDLTTERAERPSRVELVLTETKTIVAHSTDADDWQAEVHEAKIEKQIVSFAGVVTTNLWASAVNAGMDPHLVTQLADVFAWQLDFNREVREDDRWRLSVERHFANGKPIGYGEILAAEYQNAGITYAAVRYTSTNGETHYYGPDGNSLRRMFLKSPLKFGRVTSGFQARRFHPILKISRPHLGVDYGAPTGTPIMAVGDATVSFAGNRGASGKMIQLRHNGLYKTEYKHLSRFAAGVSPGSRVGMGQVIGYVGTTGLSTGPHLHFEFHIGNSVVDPQGMRFPTAEPVPAAEKKLFAEATSKAVNALPAWDKMQMAGQLAGEPGSAATGKAEE